MKCKAYFDKKNELMLEVFDTDEESLKEYAKACNLNEPNITSFDKKEYTLYIPKVSEEIYRQLCEIAKGEIPEFQALQMQASKERNERNQYAHRDMSFITLERSSSKKNKVEYKASYMNSTNLCLTIISDNIVFLSTWAIHFSANLGISAYKDGDNIGMQQLIIPKINKKTYNALIDVIKKEISPGFKKGILTFQQLCDSAEATSQHDDDSRSAKRAKI